MEFKLTTTGGAIHSPPRMLTKQSQTAKKIIPYYIYTQTNKLINNQK